jgi:Tol biopolymer transport system component
MTLSAGTKLGPYEIEAAIGAGGMGEVYRAKDTRLEREVAIKVLPPHLSSSEEMRQRFEREAKTISQLSHPHICALYDVNREGETEYLVMEYLEGESLADRLGKGALPSEQLLRYGIEIADALDKAHRQGIVHRDLKPGNVMITKSGVKLLDFGLAKYQVAAQPVSGVSRLATEAQASQPLTERGTVLGTFQYMAPEQLEGKEADARSDIFAFGCVLYEMATGHKAFTGKSQASLISSIMREDPAPISTIAPMTPPALNRVVKTCLAKDPDDRFQTAHDVKLQLQWVAEGGSEAGLPAPVVARRKNREKVAWAAAAVAVLAAAAFAFGFFQRAPKPARTMRFDIEVPPEVSAVDAPRISPDGRILAFDATDATAHRIWVRPLNALEAHPLPGTEGTRRPFWSPDSRYLAFIADGKLMKVDVSGGPPQKICDAPTGSDGTWSPDGLILFDGGPRDPIQRVPASGGVPVPIVKPDPSRKEVEVGWPEVLPDGKHFLYMALNEKASDSMYRIASLDGKENHAFAPAQSLVTYVEPGYLLYLRERTLVAQPFDAKTLKTTGEPIPIAEKVGTDAVGLARFSVSREGTLVYRTGEVTDRMVWVDRGGKELETLGDPAQYHDPAISPDGRRLAFDMVDPRAGRFDVWIRDLARGVTSRLSFSKGDAFAPLWSPDGGRVVYTADTDLVEKAADGQGAETPLVKSDELKIPSDWTRDGRYIAFASQAKDTKWDIWMLPTFGDRKPFPWLKTTYAEIWPVFSPDGRYVAYQSNESGRYEVYVQSFPGPGGKWQISSAGGTEPHWRADGKELYYRSADQKLMAVEVTTGATLEAGVAKALFPVRLETGLARNRFLPAKDGQRFLLVASPAREAMSPTTIVLNWMAGLGK